LAEVSATKQLMNASNGTASNAGAAASIHSTSFSSIAHVQTEKEHLLVLKAIAAHGSGVVVLAGAPLAGLAGRIAERVPVPVVDCVAAAVKQAEVLVSLKPRKATAGTFRRPSAKPSTGLPSPLAAWISHEGTT
jgi:allantoin racemase